MKSVCGYAVVVHASEGYSYLKCGTQKLVGGVVGEYTLLHDFSLLNKHRPLSTLCACVYFTLLDLCQMPLLSQSLGNYMCCLSYSSATRHGERVSQ